MASWSDDLTSDPGTTTGPRFCPRCRREGPERAALCPECGETLHRQGYCPICEAPWPRPVGSLCPKHDVALEDESDSGHDAADGRGEVGAAEWVTVGTFADTGEAEVARIRLEAEGIPTFLQGERMGSRSMYTVATGGLKLQVPRPLAADARILLSQSWTPPSDDDLDDAWDELAPEPGATRRRIMKGVIVFMLLTPLWMALTTWLCTLIASW